MIFSDAKYNSLGEPYHNHLMTMGIAITQLHFEIPGLVGLDQIYHIFRSSTQPGVYAPQVNKAIQEILELKSIDPLKVHAYENDLYQIYFAILAFKIFGIKFQALLYLWVSIFFASILGYLIAFFKRPKELIESKYEKKAVIKSNKKYFLKFKKIC